MASRSLAEFAASWLDTPDAHGRVVDTFRAAVNADPELKSSRDHIEAGAWGFGDRAFHWLWKLVIDEIPPVFSFMEVGVHRGQVLSLVMLLAERTKRSSTIVGVSTFDGVTGNIGPERDYREDVLSLLDERNHYDPLGSHALRLIKGNSTADATIRETREFAPFDIVYIDGSHEEADVRQDVLNYGPMTKPGGYFLMDDSGNHLKQPWGFFAGIEPVSVAADALLPPFGPDRLPSGERFQHLGNVMHLRVWKREE